MEQYDYEAAVRKDARDWLEENGDRLADESGRVDRGEAYDEMLVDDGVTGNASGSYTFSTWTAEENLCHNLDLLKECAEESGADLNKVLDSAEDADVLIRCEVLGRVVDEVVEEYNEAHGGGSDDEDDEGE